MIFDNCEAIENDIKDRISSYIKQDDYYADIKGIISLLRSYLYEMKRMKEIESYDVDEVNQNKFNILFYKDDISYKFGISMDLELRNLKIKKIISNKVLD
jgi:hypothetical protein